MTEYSYCYLNTYTNIIEPTTPRTPLVLDWSGLVQEKQCSLIWVYVKRGVRGVSCAISAFSCGLLLCFCVVPVRVLMGCAYVACVLLMCSCVVPVRVLMGCAYVVHVLLMCSCVVQVRYSCVAHVLLLCCSWDAHVLLVLPMCCSCVAHGMRMCCICCPCYAHFAHVLLMGCAYVARVVLTHYSCDACVLLMWLTYTLISIAGLTN